MADIIIDKIQIKRGLKANLPLLDEGEPALCTDTGEIALGTSTGNIFINFESLKMEQLQRLGITQDKKLTVDGQILEGSGSGILSFQTLEELQTAYPNGTSQPVWISSESSWYYWDGAIVEDTTPPNDVTNLTTSNITATSLTLSWTASSSTDVSGYEIYRGSTLLTTVTGTSYNISGLTASTAYTFTVKAKDTSNNVSNGISVNATTTNLADTTAPNNVTNLTTSNLSDVSVTLNWTASTSSDVASYDIYKDGVFLVNTANTSYTVNGLTQSTQYTFSVRAKDGANNVATGTEVTVTTLDLTAPANVTNLASSNITQTGVTLTWTASTSTDVANYQIYKDGVNIGQSSVTEFIVSGLTAGTQYNFTVKTKDLSANESTGTSVSVTTSAAADTTAPVLTITPAATFTDTQTVTMSANETATIYYTLDGTTPTTSSSVYSTALTLSATTTVKAFAKDTSGNESVVQTVTYTKQAPADAVKGNYAADYTSGSTGNTKYVSLPSTVMNEASYTKVAYVNTANMAMTGGFNIFSSSQSVLWVNNGAITGGQGSTYSDAVGVTIAANTWYHVVQVFDGTTLKYYVDGVEKLSKASSVQPDQTDVRIGSLSGSYQWGGYIAGAWIYDRALTAQEILDHKNGTVVRTNLLGEYLFENQNANDTSGNGNNGTLGSGIIFKDVSAI